MNRIIERLPWYWRIVLFWFLGGIVTLIFDEILHVVIGSYQFDGLIPRATLFAILFEVAWHYQRAHPPG